MVNTMKRFYKVGLILLLLLMVVSCRPDASNQVTPVAGSNLSQNPAELDPAQIEAIKAASQAYLEAWKVEDYSSMYDLLTAISRDALSRDEFIRHYQGIATEAALTGVDYEIQSFLFNPPDAGQVSYQVNLHSLLVGDIRRQSQMNLRLEGEDWRVEWDDTLVLPELAGGNYLGMELDIPARANIYDRSGHALVAQVDATAIGLYPDQINPQQEGKLFEWLTRLTDQSEAAIRDLYAQFPAGAGWYLPLAEVPAEQVVGDYDALSELSGLVLRPYKARYYFDNGIAPHLVGYVSAIQPEEVDAYKRKGYQQDERVGRAGLEKWGEPFLAGQRGGTLYVYNSQGQYYTKLAETSAKPSQSIYTTLDRDFQLTAQNAIAGFSGAIVVLERDTGRVLALVSSPGFDPNAFEPVNFNSSSLLSDLNDQDRPLFNRATQGQYPLGSVFKIITMAAALDSGLYSPDTPYQCGYVFDEIPGVPRYDWTYEYYQQDGVTQSSGLLSLSGGLIRSCNPYFWHIGLDLYNRGMDKAISDMARNFGLGSQTGVQAMEEAAGYVPDPQNEVDAINLAIGQGEFQVTPLQVADFVAAVGNGGILYRPQVIETIAPPGGDPTYEFKPEIRGRLPLSKENLQAIQSAMHGVVASTQPRGTAYHIFSGLDINVAGKTGTAQSGSDQPHAWFAGYTFEEREDKPDIAIAVVVDNIGEGSVYAAPIFRRIVELYFRGTPGRLYPWESTYNVTPTPELPENGTPTPTP
jgi:penicillin-binding protein 2